MTDNTEYLLRQLLQNESDPNVKYVFFQSKFVSLIELVESYRNTIHPLQNVGATIPKLHFYWLNHYFVVVFLDLLNKLVFVGFDCIFLDVLEGILVQLLIQFVSQSKLYWVEFDAK